MRGLNAPTTEKILNESGKAGHFIAEDVPQQWPKERLNGRKYFIDSHS